MTILKLMHPTVGFVDQKQVGTKTTTRKNILQTWRYRYGKKFDECTVESISVRAPKRKQIFYIPTEEVYQTLRAASDATGFHVDTISKHCRGIIGPEYKHWIKFKYAC